MLVKQRGFPSVLNEPGTISPDEEIDRVVFPAVEGFQSLTNVRGTTLLSLPVQFKVGRSASVST